MVQRFLADKRMVQRFLADKERDVHLGNVAASPRVLLIDVRELFDSLREGGAKPPIAPEDAPS